MKTGIPRLRLRGDAPKPGRTTVLPIATGAIPAALADVAAAAGFLGAAGQVARVSAPGFPDLVLAGAGTSAWERAGGEAMALLDATPPPVDGPARRIALDLRGLDPADAIAVATGAALRAWTPPIRRKAPLPKRPRLILHVGDPDDLAEDFLAMQAVLAGVGFCRTLVTEPANILTPERFAARLRRLERFGMSVDILGVDALAKAGAGAILAVGQASANPPCLAILRWAGSAGGDPLVLVGKGMTFDTGGISIKPAAGMEDMRADMAGAAACAGALLALALRQSPAPVTAVLALAENMPGANAWRPGDVIRTLSGRTVETIDTDAEGRMVLADALAWAVRHEHPAALVDLATLTGSIVTALGHHRAGMFGTDPPLLAQVGAAGEATGDAVWHMPIAAGHEEPLKSQIADLRQCATGRLQPDACHAAAFLRHFAEGIPWVHLDIAGVESREEADWRGPAGATGFGVRLLDALAAARFEHADRA
ncbi:leucyl aminopeptidase family protein [Humitalea sp. 24SJ18S-53]|uniref:leucyl aminopeptidase family protein n=1 Tax=Humitalea sp. 24SJ18S-53 TaxID=3422307 RepID=UPI003D66D9EB